MTEAPDRALQAFFTPPEPAAVAGRTLIVVDTLRATTAITTLIAGGALAVYPCSSHEAARRLAAALPGSRLCGETNGLPPPGFDFGNSPVEFAALDTEGWTVVLSTTNGTRALALAAQASGTLVGCLRNRAAVAVAAQAVFGEPVAAQAVSGEPAIVCAGEEGGTVASVEDAFTAGAVIERLIALDRRQEPEPVWRLSSGARLMRRAFLAYEGSAEAAFADSPHAGELRALGFAADLTYAAELDVETCVPRASIDEAGRVVVRGGS